MDNISLDPDPNWPQILDPDPNSMYLDPQQRKKYNLAIFFKSAEFCFFLQKFPVGRTVIRIYSSIPKFNFMDLDKINRIRRDPDPQPCRKVWYIYLVLVPGVTPRMLKGDD